MQTRPSVQTWGCSRENGDEGMDNLTYTSVRIGRGEEGQSRTQRENTEVGKCTDHYSKTSPGSGHQKVRKHSETAH